MNQGITTIIVSQDCPAENNSATTSSRCDEHWNEVIDENKEYLVYKQKQNRANGERTEKLGKFLKVAEKLNQALKKSSKYKIQEILGIKIKHIYRQKALSSKKTNSDHQQWDQNLRYTI